MIKYIPYEAIILCDLRMSFRSNLIKSNFKISWESMPNTHLEQYASHTNLYIHTLVTTQVKYDGKPHFEILDLPLIIDYPTSAIFIFPVELQYRINLKTNKHENIPVYYNWLKHVFSFLLISPSNNYHDVGHLVPLSMLCMGVKTVAASL